MKLYWWGDYMTHADLVAHAERWLRRACGCGAVLTELAAHTGNGEVPDAIGFRSTCSILVECKTSRADFLADRKKVFRYHPWLGMGSFRFYMTPPGVVDESDLPDGWGLLYSDGRRVQRIRHPKGNMWNDSEFLFERRSVNAEMALLVSALRRYQTTN